MPGPTQTCTAIPTGHQLQCRAGFERSNRGIAVVVLGVGSEPTPQSIGEAHTIAGAREQHALPLLRLRDIMLLGSPLHQPRL